MAPLSLQALIELRNDEALRGHSFNVDVLEDIIAEMESSKSTEKGE